MLCPVCHEPLKVTERQGIEIDYCPKCRGVWLDRGELDKLIERAAAYDQQFSAPVPAPAPVAPPPADPFNDPPKRKRDARDDDRDYRDRDRDWDRDDRDRDDRDRKPKKRRESFLKDLFEEFFD